MIYSSQRIWYAHNEVSIELITVYWTEQIFIQSKIAIHWQNSDDSTYFANRTKYVVDIDMNRVNSKSNLPHIWNSSMFFKQRRQYLSHFAMIREIKFIRWTFIDAVEHDFTMSSFGISYFTCRIGPNCSECLSCCYPIEHNFDTKVSLCEYETTLWKSSILYSVAMCHYHVY